MRSYLERPAEELYRLDDDAYELQNLAEDPAHGERLAELRSHDERAAALDIRRSELLVQLMQFYGRHDGGEEIVTLQ